MNEWLQKIQKEQKWAVELDKLGLKKEIEGFWKRLEGKGKEKEERERKEEKPRRIPKSHSHDLA